MVKVLIAEDVAEIRFAYEAILMGVGYQVDSVKDGRDAVARIEQEDFDIVITDLMMPQKDGFDVVEAVKQHRPDAKVLVITGGGDQMSPYAAIKLKEAEIDRMLIKAVEQKALLDAVARLSSN